MELGCTHYKRGCKLKSACCGEYFTCLRCHDEKKDHPMIRYDIERVLCLFCKKEQEPKQDCSSCGKRLGKYYCEVCRFYDNDESKVIYHCPHCQICRIGRGLGIDHEHCHTCKTCLKLGVNHKCIENNMLSDCPICKQYLFTSTAPVNVLPRCGHAIHLDCLNEFRKTNWRCPVCSKSLVAPDSPYLQSLFAEISREIALQPMPTELSNIPVEILCNDCDQKATVFYHFIGHRCPNSSCTSYNTRRIKAEGIPTRASTSTPTTTPTSSSNSNR
jgi:uncharacterized CHY-type Zn-finger protein